MGILTEGALTFRAIAALALATLISALLEALLHVWKWNIELGHEMAPPWTYVVGMMPILTTYSAWLAYLGRVDWLVGAGGLAIIVGGSGLIVIGLYKHDDDRGKRLEREVTGKSDARPDLNA